MWNPYFFYYVRLLVTVTSCFAFSSCGNDVKFKPGPALSGVIDREKKAEASASRWEILSKKVDQCGESSGVEGGVITVEASMPLTVKIEEIRDKESARTSISFEGKRFNWDILQKTLMSNRELLSSSSLKGTETNQILELVPKINNVEKPAIVIRVNCFELEDGEVISTEGRDLYILADKVLVNGTIRTTPAPIEDFPGQNAGDLTILAIKSEFGPNALLDVSGGDAGKITSYPGIVITDENTSENLANKRRIIDEIRRDLLIGKDDGVKDWSPDTLKFDTVRQPNPDDPLEMEQLITAYENVRNNLLVSDIQGAEAVLIDMAKRYVWRHGASPHGMSVSQIEDFGSRMLAVGLTDEDRRSALNDRLAGIRKWRIIWTLALIQRRLDAAPSDGLTGKTRSNSVLWLVDGKLAVSIRDTVVRDKIRKDADQRTIYYRDSVIYESILGGAPGRLSAVSGKANRVPRYFSAVGRMGKIAPQSSWIYKVGAGEKFLPIGLREKIIRKFEFTSRKNFDDKVTLPDEYSIELEGIADSEHGQYEIHDRKENPIAKLHPNAGKRIPKDLFEPVFESDLELLKGKIAELSNLSGMPLWLELRSKEENK